MKIFIKLFVALLRILSINCDYWEYNLVHDLLTGYDPSIRPSVHHNASLNVTFGLALAQIIDVVSLFHFFFVYQLNFKFLG